ncbi:hypothetical protein [Roseinatronobacter alkalisoli]|uniref:Uncharacterized protein n=1 Tax=Roseinatronobacter alkalisoli TaxID=3028235 RepID=A0ABT5TAS9_9RHOB|nr:hypothetical protein [Roseinatronobacter sp. HJB301]MDD7971506.1 hypothetical protein [Roseinatronobacter sp. HJB301]
MAMDFEVLFLLGVYLLPLALVSALSAWSDNRKPVLGLLLSACSGGLLVWVWRMRPQGMYGLRDIPELTVGLVARIMTYF